MSSRTPPSRPRRRTPTWVEGGAGAAGRRAGGGGRGAGGAGPPAEPDALEEEVPAGRAPVHQAVPGPVPRGPVLDGVAAAHDPELERLREVLGLADEEEAIR